MMSLFTLAHTFSKYATTGRLSTANTKLYMSSGPISYKVGFMFPGQGAQAVGMGAALANDIPAAKALYVTASSILGT